MTYQNFFFSNLADQSLGVVRKARDNLCEIIESCGVSVSAMVDSTINHQAS